MHRSGTSALAGCLETYGLFLGDVVRTAPHNRRGNNENLEIRTLHDQVLADSEGAWDNPPPVVTWHAEHRRTLRYIIDAFADAGRWGFKDPRTLLTLDAWLEEIPDLTLVGTFRHPARVVHSLLARHPSMQRRHALELWFTYNEVLLSLVRDRGALIICFDLPTAHYLASVRQLANAITLAGSNGTFFTPELRHWSGTDWHDMPSRARQLYDRLLEVSLTPEASANRSHD